MTHLLINRRQCIKVGNINLDQRHRDGGYLQLPSHASLVFQSEHMQIYDDSALWKDSLSSGEDNALQTACIQMVEWSEEIKV